MTLARDHAPAFNTPAPRRAVRAHLRGADRDCATLPTAAIAAPRANKGARSASAPLVTGHAPPGQSSVGGSVPGKRAPPLDALGSSLPAGQKRENANAVQSALGGRSFTHAALSARTLSTRSPSTPSTPSGEGRGNVGEKRQRPRGSLLGPLFTDASREVREEDEMAPGQLIELATVPLAAGTEDACNIGHLYVLDSVRVSAIRGG